ncbi:MAG: Copper-exporting P-type ATPase B [Methanosaeta sp. PtaU1.Bin112]|nr:MAG: Copper-exporting P-type ATPase B [Methanosaeta sp. PtaU1.Bin112]
MTWHSNTTEEALQILSTKRDGLSDDEASRRLEEYGLNQLESPHKPSPIRIFLNKFKDYLIIVLIFAAIVSYIAGETTNAYVVLAIIILVAFIGFLQEYRAERSMEALREMVAPEADVFRNGKLVSIPVQQLVAGDVIFLEAGDKVPADARIIDETLLEVVEASLTGESQPVKKSTELLGEETSLADRKNMVFMGTIVSYGNCKAVVTDTGRKTELGKISGMIGQESEEPPLKKKLAQLAKRQAYLVLLVSALVFIIDVNRGYPITEVFITSVALAVAGVPEALPFVVTLAMAYGTQIMAKKHAIIRSLPAVETLGSTTVICSDKTGTLTTGETTVRQIYTYRTIEVTGSGYNPEGSFISDGKPVYPSEEDIASVLRICVLSNNSDVDIMEGKWRIVGDPTEGALIVAAKKAGVVEKIRDEHIELVEYPFDSDRKRMTTVSKSESEGIIAAMKGAPEVVLDRCVDLSFNGQTRPLTDDDRKKIQDIANVMAERALRVLAVAWKPLYQEGPIEKDFVESEMIFAGLVGMMDPPRPEVKEAIQICKQAGIRPMMITGDHRLTAKAIGEELGIAEGEVIEGWQIEKMSDKDLTERIENTSIFARVTAEHKMRIVDALKSQGHIVAMTGDGVNDAPALKAADIGVAMGRTGTEVSKEASAMVITDDNFATIVSAVKEGRRIFDNIRKSTSYLLSVSFAELATIFVGIMLGFPAPLLAAQILWINVVAEEFPAIGLAMEPSNPKIMHRMPRNPKESMPSRTLLIYTLGTAAIISAGCLGLYITSIQQGHNLDYSRTMAFVGLGFFTVFNAYASRSLEDSILKMNPLDNKALILGMGASIIAILAAIYVPFLQNAFGTVPLTGGSWAIILGVSSLIIVVSEVMKRALTGLGKQC